MRRLPALLLAMVPLVLLAQGRPGGGPPPGFGGGARPAALPEDAYERQLRQNRLGLWVLVEDDGATWGTAAKAAMEEDPLVELNLPLLVAGGRKGDPMAAYLRERYGWVRGGRWALVDAGGQVLAEGATLPTATALGDAAQRSGVRSRAQELAAFLLQNPDHLEAQVALLKERILLASRRTRKLLGLAEPKPAAGPDGSAPMAPAAPVEPRLLEDEVDQKVWGEAARLLQALFNGPWQETYSDLPRALTTAESAHSPLMRDLWVRVLPAVEEALHRQPSDEDLWRIWVLGAEQSGGRPLGTLLDTLAPLPGTAPEDWPPESVLGAFVRDARQRLDWRAIREALEPRWDAWRRDPRRVAMGGGPQGADRLWSRVLSPLLEALLQAGDGGTADQLVNQAQDLLRWEGLGTRARDLAQRLGRPDLAARWGASAAPTAPRSR